MKLIHLKDLKKDQKFYEYFYSEAYEFIALEDPYISGEIEIDGKEFAQWKCLCKSTEDNREVAYLTTEGHEHYAAKIYIDDSLKFNSLEGLIEKYKEHKLIKVTKLESLNEVSKNSKVHKNYWVIGIELNGPPEINKPYQLIRIANSVNPMGKDGIFYTSPIQMVYFNPQTKTTKLRTLNSEYELIEINKGSKKRVFLIIFTRNVKN